MHRQQQNRYVGRIDLFVARRRGQRLRQLLGGDRDGRLHVLGGGVDVTFEVELNNDRGGAERTRRRHLRNAGDLTELLLERRRDRSRHGLGAGAGPGRRHLDGRKVDLRQRRHRQERKGDDADEGERRHQQRGSDRPSDERFGYVHDWPPRATARGSMMVTAAPVCSLYWPSVTTRSPAAMPEVTMVRSSVVVPVTMGRGSTVLS